MTMTRVMGLVLLAVGVLLLMLGLTATDSLMEQISQMVTGHFTERTTWYIVGGIAALVCGAALALFGRPASA
jgi:hypothetical protein